ncbi:MAG: hypothetical protein KatS3mg114_0346 [Planctomycetaceae bacterium]|nr:MAG: hypothetical protein KatS3mg114_0346 [Planctomycetaceae bacterium]
MVTNFPISPRICWLLIALWLTPLAWSQSRFDHDARQFRQGVVSLLLEGDYPGLERLAERLRRERPTFLNGRAQLLELYDALGDVRGPEPQQEHDRRQIEDRLKHLEHWHRTAPSATSRIALAVALLTQSWIERGTGTIDQVRLEALQSIPLRMKRAGVLLREAEEILSTASAVDPALYYHWLRVGVLDAYPRDTMQSLLRRSLLADPTFVAVLDIMAQYLLPRWYGEPDDLLELAASTTELTRDSIGQTAYAIVALNAWNYGEIEAFSPTGFQWSRVRQGFYDWLKQAPDSPYRWGWLAKFAHVAGDRETARDAVAHLNNRWHTTVFPRQVDWLRTKTWATETNDSGQQQLLVEFGPRNIMDVIFLGGGKTFLPGTRERTLQFFSADNGELLQEIPLLEGKCELLQAAPDGLTLYFTAPRYAQTQVYRLELSTSTQTLLGTMEGRIRALCLSSDGQKLVASNDRGQLRLWRLTSPPLPYEWKADNAHHVTGLACSPDGEQLISVAERHATWWDLSSRQARRTWQVHPLRARCVAWSPTQPLIVTAGHTNQLTLWDPAQETPVGRITGGNSSIQSVVFTPDGERMIAATMSTEQPQIPGEIVIVEVAQRQVVQVLRGHRLGIWKIVVDPSGRQLASASEDGTVRLWNLPE